MKILIVEPDEYYHTRFREDLGESAEMTFFRGGAEAADALAGGGYDFLITELLFSDGHVYELLPKVQNVPIIVYTKVAHLADAAALLNHGVMGYFVKGQDTVGDIKKLLFTPYYSLPLANH